MGKRKTAKQLEARRIELVGIEKEIEQDDSLSKLEKKELLDCLKSVIAEYSWILGLEQEQE